jgi:phosphatidylserine/phosphatidylglycerophosphate/cardiolipin synthase-like enzyme
LDIQVKPKEAGNDLKLLTQPADGIGPLVRAIRKAKKSVEVVIFRVDCSEIEQALVDAVQRGVFVHALIAFTNRGGEDRLRKLEMRLLEKGVSVTRTADDMVRYHGKMMVIDRKELHLLAFNFTHLDIEHSRSFGLVMRNPGLVREAEKLFKADAKRQSYVAGQPRLVVSPVNARERLASFIKGAKKELLIYDPKISDRKMLRVLQNRKSAGVEIRVIGKVGGNRLPARAISGLRLHTRTIVRDRQQAFIGSQSLRPLELDSRREIGVIFRNRMVISALAQTFDRDWNSAKPNGHDLLAGKALRKMAKAVGKNLPVAPLVKQVVKAVQSKRNLELGPAEVEETVKTAVKEAVKDSVKDATKEAIKALVAQEEMGDGEGDRN